MAKWLISNFPVLYLTLNSSVQLSRTANLNQRLLATNWEVHLLSLLETAIDDISDQ